VAAGREVAITTAPRISSNKQTQRILNKRTQGTILLSTDNLIRRSEMNLFGKRQPLEPAAVGVDAATNVQPMKWNHEPEMSASFLNGLFFVWIQPMFSCAAFLKKKGQFLEKEDLAPLVEMDKTVNVERMFQNAYANYIPNTKKSVEDDGCEDSPEELEHRLVHSLIATCKRRIIEGGFFRLFNSALQFSFPILLNLILSYYQDIQSGVITKDDPPTIYYKGYWLSILLMLFVQMKALTESAYFRLSEVPPAIILGTAADNRWRNRKSYAGGRYED